MTWNASTAGVQYADEVLEEVGPLCTSRSAVLLLGEVPQWHLHDRHNSTLTSELSMCAIGVSRSSASRVREVGEHPGLLWCVVDDCLCASVCWTARTPKRTTRSASMSSLRLWPRRASSTLAVWRHGQALHVWSADVRAAFDGLMPESVLEASRSFGISARTRRTSA